MECLCCFRCWNLTFKGRGRPDCFTGNKIIRERSESSGAVTSAAKACIFLISLPYTSAFEFPPDLFFQSLHRCVRPFSLFFLSLFFWRFTSTVEFNGRRASCCLRRAFSWDLTAAAVLMNYFNFRLDPSPKNAGSSKQPTVKTLHEIKAAFKIIYYLLRELTFLSNLFFSGGWSLAMP